jgi:hypothetical protein
LVRICGSVVQWFRGSGLGLERQWFSGSVVQRVRIRISIRIRERRGDPSVWLEYVVQWFSGSEGQD